MKNGDMKRVLLERKTIVTTVATVPGNPSKEVGHSMWLTQDLEVAIRSVERHLCRVSDGSITHMWVTRVFHFMEGHGWEEMELMATGPLAPTP